LYCRTETAFLFLNESNATTVDVAGRLGYVWILKKDVTAMLSVEDIPALLAEMPIGSWVALAHDDARVVAYGAELQEVVQRAKESGENDPIVTRVPQTQAAVLR